MGTLPDPLWHFAQVFGERQPGDEIQDGEDAAAPVSARPRRSAGSGRGVRSCLPCPAERQHDACSFPASCVTQRLPRPRSRCRVSRACGLIADAFVMFWPISAADIISAIEFDATGDQLATGDRGGRVVLFQRVDSGRGEQVRPQPHAAASPDASEESGARATRGSAARCAAH